MNQWSLRRRRIILGIVLLFLLIVVGIPSYFLFHKTPICTDGKQNGDETGVDCGGSCMLLCPAESLPILSKGDPQVLPLTPATFDVVAYMENPNVSGTVLSAPYTLSLYTATGSSPIANITGATFVPKNASFALFQGPFAAASGTPTRAVLRWGALEWQKDTSPVPTLTIRDASLSRASTTPRLEATLINNNLQPVENIELVALIYDESGTIVHASRTIVSTIAAGESVPLVFTWPAPFVGTTTSIEIVPRIFPSDNLIK